MTAMAVVRRFPGIDMFFFYSFPPIDEWAVLNSQESNISGFPLKVFSRLFISEFCLIGQGKNSDILGYGKAFVYYIIY